MTLGVTQRAVLSGGIAIPDSVVTQFDPSSFTTGDAAWSDDVRSNDMSMQGDPQAVTLSDGSDGVEGDGTDDLGLSPMPAELSGSSLTSFAIEFEIQTTDSGTSVHYFGNREGSGQAVEMAANTDASFSDDQGNFLIAVDDDAGNNFRFAPSTSPNINDGNRHTILINIVDTTANSAEIYVDGSQVSLSYAAQQNPSSFISWTQDTGWFGRQNNGSVENYTNNAFGVIRLHETSISGPTL